MSSKRNLLPLLVFVLATGPLAAQEFDPLKSSPSIDPRTLSAAADNRGFDVLHYRFEWTLDPAQRSISGAARLRARSTSSGLTVLRLDLADTMTVGGARQGGSPAAFSHAGGLLDISLDRAYAHGQEFEVEVVYGGVPSQNLTFSLHDGQPVIYSLDEPTGARQWFPCHDLPDDKATAEVVLTVPGDMLAASNGTLVSTATNVDGTKTFAWRENYPISTYLLFVAATNYVTLRDTYVSTAGEVEVVHYVYPELLDLAREDLNPTVSMLAFFSEIFGEYPFALEKYGHALIPGGTAMEHQTCTSYPSRCILGTHQYDWLIAHELAHSWWGDWVTCAEWEDIWLNEGFATYSDALWQEEIGGPAGLRGRLRQFKDTYLTHQQPDHPIYDPPEGHLFCRVEYQKAAWVLHMLRGVVGDKVFFDILAAHRQRHGGGNATTADFIDTCQQVSGLDLTWFFSQWVYGAGLPTYEFGWSRPPGSPTVQVLIRQVQAGYPLFRMPVELEFVAADGSTRRESVMVERAEHRFDFSLSPAPVEVRFDPDSRILCHRAPLQKQFRKAR